MPLSRQLLILSLMQFAVCIILIFTGLHFTGVCLGAAWGVAMTRDSIKREQIEHEKYIADVMDTSRP